MKKLIEFDKFKKLIFEAMELHLYPNDIQTKILDRLTDGNEDYDLNTAYWNNEAKVFWLRKSNGYFHILKPINFKQLDGSLKFAFKDLLISNDGIMKEINRYKFDDKDEAKEWLKKKYHYNETISLSEKKKRKKKNSKKKFFKAHFFPPMIMPFLPKPPKGGPGPVPPPPGPGPMPPPPPGPPPAGAPVPIGM